MQAGAFAGPVGHCGAAEFGAVVSAQHGRMTVVDGKAVELGDEVVTGDVAVDQAAKAFTVCSSTMDTILIGRPSVVASNLIVRRQDPPRFPSCWRLSTIRPGSRTVRDESAEHAAVGGDSAIGALDRSWKAQRQFS